MAEMESPLKLPTLVKLKHGDKRKRAVSFADTRKKGVSFADNAEKEENAAALDTIEEGDSEKSVKSLH